MGSMLKEPGVSGCSTVSILDSSIKFDLVCKIYIMSINGTFENAACIGVSRQ